MGHSARQSPVTPAAPEQPMQSAAEQDWNVSCLMQDCRNARHPQWNWRPKTFALVLVKTVQLLGPMALPAVGLSMGLVSPSVRLTLITCAAVVPVMPSVAHQRLAAR